MKLSWVKIFIYDVDHGLCSSVIDSSGNVLLVDCGRGRNFSPIKHIAGELGVSLQTLSIDLFVLSHPHGDHIEDISNLLKTTVRNKHHTPISSYTDQELRTANTQTGYDNIRLFEKSYSHFTSDGYSPPNWVFSLNTEFSLSVADARQIDKNNVLNNSSRMTIIEYSGVKIVFTGDIQANAWPKLLSNSSFVAAALYPSVVIAPHHGHKSSFCSDLYNSIGKPFLNICSLAKGDLHLSSQYSCDTASKGCILYGENRWMLSTRSDGTVIITINDDKWTVDYQQLSSNDF